MGEVEYTVTLIFYTPFDQASSALRGQLTFELDTDLPAGFVLQLDDSKFRSPNASKRTTSYGVLEYTWENSGLNWAHGDEVAVSLVANHPATGVTISGMAHVGETLTADISAIADPDGIPEGVTYTYQWTSSDDDDTYTEIAGETGSTYTLQRSDVGKTIRVEVSFTDTASFDETVASDASAAVVVINLPPTGQPTITGTAEVGLTLTADASGIADAYSYRWLSSDDGVTYTAIREEAGLTYMLRQSDHGKTIKFEVSFTDSDRLQRGRPQPRHRPGGVGLHQVRQLRPAFGQR